MELVVITAVSVFVWFFALSWYIVTDFIESRYSNRWFIEFQKLSKENQELKEKLKRYEK